MKDERYKTDNLYFILFLLVLSFAFLSTLAFGQPGTNNRNVTIETTLNITNSIPEIIAHIQDDPITLSAGTTRNLTCNVTVRDFDGSSDIDYVNATLFDTATSTLFSANDFNDHYTDTNCSLINNGSITSNYSCSFLVEYYANNATTWNCTAFAEDSASTVGNGSNSTTISALLALNITPTVVDYGDLAVGDISNITTVNITNFGNVHINVTVRGYGAAEGDNLAMVCDQNNIPVNEERFSLNSTDVWPNMLNITSSPTNITGLDLIQRTNDTAGAEVINSTYWRIRVPISSNPSGVCNGSLVFQAEAY